MSKNEPAQGSLASVEITGPTLEEAIDTGLRQLGLLRNEVIIEIVQEGSKGVLGMGAREAVVKLTPLRPPKPPVEKPAPSPASILPVSSEEELEEEANVAREVLEELLGLMKIKARVRTYRAKPAASDEDPPWVFDIEGPDLGVLIGRRGETLNALQYITRLLVSRELQRRTHIVLDVEGYKSRREEALSKLADRMAAQALKLGRTVALEPMPPNERRIIHIALRENDAVRTESIGEGDRRKVTIVPID